MRIATSFLIVATLVCASHVEASWLDSAKQSVGSLVQSVTDNANKATEMLQNGVNKAKEQTDAALEKLKEAGAKVEEKVKESVDNVVQSVDKKVNEVTAEAEKENVDVSECKQIVTALREAASTIVKDTVSCITGTITNATTAVADVYTTASNTMREINALRKKSQECTDDTEGILARVSSTACLTTVNTKIAWYVTTGVPSVILKLVSTTKQVVALPSTLTSCISTTAIGALVEQSRNVVDQVKACVAEKTGKPIEKKQEPTPKVEEKVSNNPVGWLKSLF